MPSRFVLFDLDGTLVDSSESVDRCWNRLAEEAGFDKSRLHGLHGTPASTFIKMLLGEERSQEASHWIQWHLKNEVDDVAGTMAIEGVLDLLAWLTEHPEFDWGIVTSCQLPLALARINAAGIPMPAVLVTADDVSVGKPDPEPYVIGAARIGAGDSDTVYVIEDAPAGLRSGTDAGLIVVGVVSTHQRHELTPANVVVDNIGELHDLLKSSVAS
jgi:sugar-phosphatase